ncbi:MAG: hypothetical protein GXO79_06660 [Chlorobi bacterium]|nr:hypothetical protein [Chlorobiota bacterium]
MKIELKIILTLITFFFFNKIFAQDTNYVLLLKYNEEIINCNLIEIDGKPIKPIKYSNEVYSEVDDFSEFFSIKKVFYYDGNIKLTENTKILFWEYDNKITIDSLPFRNNKFVINSILNDTSVKIILNQKEIVLNHKETLKDTILYTKKIGNKLFEYKVLVEFTNLGFIKKENILDNNNWKEKSFELGVNAPEIAEKMPEFKGGNQEFLNYLVKNINLNTKPEYSINGKGIVEIIIDEKGKVSSAKMIRSINKEIDIQIIETIKNMPAWKPAMNKGKTVSIKLIIPINIDMQ